MDTLDFTALIHPTLAVAFVFPLIGITTYYAWQTRRRRMVTAVEKGKSKIPPSVGPEHLNLGKWLAASVVGVALLGIGHPIFSEFITNQTWIQEGGRVAFVIAVFIATIASLVLLYRTRTALWRGIFATLTGMGLILLGAQPEVFRRGFEWYTSHYYYGVTAALLMIFSLAIVPDIYKDRQNRWRRAHGFLNLIAVLLFIGQGFTGARDLLEIPLNWQKPVVYPLFDPNCPANTCTVQVESPATGPLQVTIAAPDQ
jgi:hypothetical protein